MKINKIAIAGIIGLTAGAGTVGIVTYKKISNLKKYISEIEIEKIKLETELKFTKKGDSFSKVVKSKEIEDDVPDFRSIGKLNKKELSDEELDERLDNL